MYKQHNVTLYIIFNAIKISGNLSNHHIFNKRKKIGANWKVGAAINYIH